VAGWLLRQSIIQDRIEITSHEGNSRFDGKHKSLRAALRRQADKLVSKRQLFILKYSYTQFYNYITRHFKHFTILLGLKTIYNVITQESICKKCRNKCIINSKSSHEEIFTSLYYLIYYYFK